MSRSRNEYVDYRVERSSGECVGRVRLRWTPMNQSWWARSSGLPYPMASAVDCVFMNHPEREIPGRLSLYESGLIAVIQDYE